jgi:sugar/nucleoside kinase (ribokinase family)
MKKYHLYGIGAALVDTEIEVTDADLHQLDVEKGLMTLVDEERQHFLQDKLSTHLIASKRASGGSAANTIIAASYFGSKTFYSCKVANDANGDFYLNDLKAAGVESLYELDRSTGITGKCLVMITPDAERTMNTYLGISETLSVEQVSPKAIAASEYLYIEGYLVTSATGKAAAINARQIAEGNGVKTAISLSDPGMVQFFKPGLMEMIGESVDLLFCNRDEAFGWSATNNLDDACNALKKVAKAFAITLGGEGALLFDGEQFIKVAPHPVKAIDTNGAGDMFAGAFLYGITNGMSFEHAGVLASKSAATVVSQYGPRLKPEQHQSLLESLVN